MRNLAITLACISLYLGGCATTHAPALSANTADFGQSEDEKKLIARAAEFHKDLDRKGMLLEDAGAQAYLDSVARPLIPADVLGIVDFKFHILRTPLVNALALPDGHVYVTLGLLARLRNQAELAEVLGHEIGHVVLRHGLNQYQNRRSQVVTAHIADLILFGTSIAYLPMIASIASYSREQEEEADRFGLRQITAQGYQSAAAIEVFAVLQEVKKAEAIEGSWYSSHPSNQERAGALKKLTGDSTLPENPSGKINTADYQKFSQPLLEENIRLKLAARQYELAADSTERALEIQAGKPVFYYFKGEALRGMAEDPKGAAREQAWIYGKTYNDALVAEMEKRKTEFMEGAEAAYRKALAMDADFLLAYRGLGLLLMHNGKEEEARTNLRRYLAQKKDVPDRQYIARLIGENTK